MGLSASRDGPLNVDRLDQVEVMRVLHQAGADLALKGSDGWDAIQCTAVHGHVGCPSQA